ncbi:hypothetical protein [Bdellovibrio sp. HCB274]|uniref:hypothetical protein n=1 Tax=Bdellovibrio sp. HCB274 TaxID=3394361 RepID=UPI0039B6B66A
MSTIKIFSSLLPFLICSPSFATVSQLVGSWTAIGGARSWQRIDISRGMIATGYRVCSGGICEGREVFRLTSYGRTKFLSPIHNVATGKVVDKENGFVATEVFELRNNQLILREYINLSTRPGGKDSVLETTFARLRR